MKINMVEPYYNTSFGTGIEGVINYSNELVGGWLATSFLSAIWIIMIYVLGKSEWRMSSVVGYSTFAVLIMSWIFKLFTDVSELFIYSLVVILAISIIWGILESNKR